MISIYTLLLYIHILSAILSIGPLFVVLAIVKKMHTAAHEEMPPYIQVFQGAITIVKHAGHVLVASGILLMWRGGYPWTTSWVVLTFLVMAGSIVFWRERLNRPFEHLIRQPTISKNLPRFYIERHGCILYYCSLCYG